MQKITCWDELRAYGVDMLTGEACGLSYRLLCDVSERGKHIIQIALGIANLDLHDSWNRGDPKEPHIGSYLVAFIMWRGPGSPRRFAHGVRPEGHITGSKSVA